MKRRYPRIYFSSRETAAATFFSIEETRILDRAYPVHTVVHPISLFVMNEWGKDRVSGVQGKLDWLSFGNEISNMKIVYERASSPWIKFTSTTSDSWSTRFRSTIFGWDRESIWPSVRSKMDVYILCFVIEKASLIFYPRIVSFFLSCNLWQHISRVSLLLKQIKKRIGLRRFDEFLNSKWFRACAQLTCCIYV